MGAATFVNRSVLSAIGHQRPDSCNFKLGDSGTFRATFWKYPRLCYIVNKMTTASIPGFVNEEDDEATLSRNGAWRVSARKRPILRAEPIEELSKSVGIPIPEMIFGDNHIAVTHVQTGWTIEFNAHDALDLVGKTSEGMLQVAVAEEWKKERAHQEEVKQVVKPFDWSYSTTYKGTTHSASSSGQWQVSDQLKDPIRIDLLSRPDPIEFFASVDLYEDELADNGIALLSIKTRVMPERLLLLSRFFLRLDGVIIRIRDTRVYIEHGSSKVIRQYTAKEETYKVVRDKLRSMRENVQEAFRDANKIAPLLRTIEDTTDVFEVQ